MAFNIPNGAFRLSAEEAGGGPDYAKALSRGFQTAADVYKPQTMAEELLKKQILNKFLPRSEEARIANTEAGTGLIGAQTGMTGENTLKQNILNGFLRQREEAEIGEIGARKNYYNQGGGRRGVGGVAENEFMNNVKLDNPDFDEADYRDVANAIRSGKDMLPDGRRLNVTPTTLESLNRVVKAGTTANLINQGVKANQGEGELKALDEYANTFEDPYQSTTFGLSPKLLADSTSPKEDAQKRFGQYIGMQALNYEKAQVRNNIAGGTPGITAINELMQHSGQLIKNHYPHVSATARKEADRVISEGIEKMRKARMKAGFSPSSISRQKEEKPIQADNAKVAMIKNGVLHFIPADRTDDALKKGYAYE